MLIGFAGHGLDSLFGIQMRETWQQSPDNYSLAGYLEILPHEMTWEIHPLMHYDQKLVIFSDIEVVNLREGTELARLYDTAGFDMKAAAVSHHTYGKGSAVYFAFDVAKTVWLLHQGRPLTGKDPDGEGYSKTGAMQLIGENSRKICYADELVLLLQSMLARTRQPFIYQIPPDGGKIPDALFYWSGDEYFGPAELSTESSNWMKSKGLPYHINIGMEKTPGKEDGHPLTLEEYKHILDNGHEVSLYYMLYDDNDFDITQERIERQSNLFHQRFGCRPGCTLHHNCSWTGWTEPARWMAAAGGKADNSFLAFPPKPHDHPTRNVPFYGFGQGTGYPFFFWEDWTQGNRRLEFIEEPIACYELGHRHLGRGHIDPDADRAYEVHGPVDTALKYHQVINVFYHPCSIVQHEKTRNAIEEILRYIEYRNKPVLHLANNQVADWWFARSKSGINSVRAGDNGVSFESICDYRPGIIVKLLLPPESEPRVLCDGKESADITIKKEFGGHWLYFIVPSGSHKLQVQWHTP